MHQINGTAAILAIFDGLCHTATRLPSASLSWYYILAQSPSPRQNDSIGALAAGGLAQAGANTDVLGLLVALYSVASLIVIKVFWADLSQLQAGLRNPEQTDVSPDVWFGYAGQELILGCVAIALLVIWLRSCFADRSPVLEGGMAIYLRRVLRCLQRAATGLFILILAIMPVFLAAMIIAFLLSGLFGPVTQGAIVIISVFAMIPIALVINMLVLIAIAHESLDRPLSLLQAAPILRPRWFQGALFLLIFYLLGVFATALVTAPVGTPDPNTLGGAIAILIASAITFCIYAIIAAGLAQRFLGIDKAVKGPPDE